MQRRWPRAKFLRDEVATAPFVARVFDAQRWRADEPLKVVLIGSDFEISVWQALLTLPLGSSTTYADLARQIGKPKAPRAVGAAVGRNPISFVVPCHRVLGAGGKLTGYHWWPDAQTGHSGLGSRKIIHMNFVHQKNDHKLLVCYSALV